MLGMPVIAEVIERILVSDCISHIGRDKATKHALVICTGLTDASRSAPTRLSGPDSQIDNEATMRSNVAGTESML